MATTKKTPTDNPFTTEEHSAAEQATAEFREGSQHAQHEVFGAASQAAESTQSVARDAFKTTTDLSVELWERNVALASRFVPAYVDSYERTVKSFSSLWEQAGQSARSTGDAAQAVRSASAPFAQAAEAVAEIPQAVGTALTQAAKAVAQVPRTLGESVSGPLPQTLPDLAKSQAAFLRDAAEASAAAVRQGVRSKDAN